MSAKLADWNYTPQPEPDSPWSTPIEPEGSWDDETVSSPSMFSLDYYREKAREFQDVLILLDQTGRDLADAGMVAYMVEDSEAIAEYETLQSQYDGMRGDFVSAAQGINFASEGLNNLGIEFPAMSIPFGLGKLGIPVAPLAIAAGAIAVTAALIANAMGFWRTVADFAARQQHLNAIATLPPEQRASALEVFQRTEKNAEIAIETASQSPITALANFGKWAAIAVLGFVAYKALNRS